MSNVTSMVPQPSARSLVISEVRAELGRKNLNASKLARLTNTTQQFWSRRLTGATAFDVDDLAALSSVLQVPMSRFMPDFVPDGGPASENAGVGPTGLEPMTSTV